MNANLIPSYDMLGLPAPPWLIQVLMALTLALHWAFLGLVVGGTVLLLANALRAPRSPVSAKVSKAIVPLFPFCLSMAMTMGIAPLLFVQVLYGNFFYSSNIILGFWWLALIGLMIANFYLFYIAQARLDRGRALGAFLPGAILALFVASALVLSSNASLTQSPGAWESLWARGGNALYLGDRALIPRMLFALFGFVAAGGIAVALLGQAGWTYDREADSAAVEQGLSLTVPATVLQILCGALALYLMPGDRREAILSGGPESAFFYVSGLAFVAALALALLAKRTPSLLTLVLPGVLYFVGLFALAFGRDYLRRQAIAPHFKVSDMPVHPQWDSFALFLVVFILGLGVVGYLVKLAQTPKPQTT